MARRYNPTVQGHIDFLEEAYTDNPDLKSFHILHMYPERKMAYPDGYYDSRFFELIGFNTDTMERRSLGRHDSLDNRFEMEFKVTMIRVFVDGSTMVKLSSPATFMSMTQGITFQSIKEEE